MSSDPGRSCQELAGFTSHLQPTSATHLFMERVIKCPTLPISTNKTHLKALSFQREVSRLSKEVKILAGKVATITKLADSIVRNALILYLNMSFTTLSVGIGWPTLHSVYKYFYWRTLTCAVLNKEQRCMFEAPVMVLCILSAEGGAKTNKSFIQVSHC